MLAIACVRKTPRIIVRKTTTRTRARAYACGSSSEYVHPQAATRRAPPTLDGPPPEQPLCCEPMSSQYIFTMHRLSKLHPPDKTVLDNITLAFYAGAKIDRK